MKTTLKLLSWSMLWFAIGSLFYLFIWGCGTDRVVQGPLQPGPTPSPTPTPEPGTKPSYQKVAAYLNTYCSQCHAGANFMSSEAALRASQASAQLYSKRMPPSNAGKVLPENVRAEILSFF